MGAFELPFFWVKIKILKKYCKILQKQIELLTTDDKNMQNGHNLNIIFFGINKEKCLMLRKKLSKVILSSLVAAMAVGVSATVGQAVKAQEVQLISEIVQNVVDVTADNIVENIKNNNVNGINVKGSIELTPEIVDALNDRTTTSEFIINFNGGSFDIKSSAAISISGNNKLTLVRDSANEKSIINISLSAQTREVANVTIDQVIFQDNSTSTSKTPLINVSELVNGKTVSISNVTINGGALLQAQNPSVGVTGETLGQGGSLYVNSEVKQEVVLDAITLNGTTLNITGTAPQNSTVTITVTEGQTTSTLTVKSDAQGKFMATHKGALDKEYKVEAKTQEISSSVQTVSTNSTVEVDVTNVTTNSATVGLGYGSTFNTYPLTLTVKDKSGNVINKPYVVENNTVKSVSVTGLSSNTTYTYELTNTDSNGTVNTLATGSFTTRTSSTIDGGQGSVVTTDISSSDVSKATIKDISIVIPVSNKSLVSSMEKGTNFNVDVKGVSVEFKNGELTLTGLVPEKEYRNIILTYVDNNNRTRTVRIPRFTTKTSETKVRQFVKDVYTYSLDRVADEEGFAYWEKQLTNKTTTAESFVKNLLSEKEFINKYTTTEGRIEGLYQVIVNRKSDSEGLKFWVNRYNELVKQGFAQEIALSVVVDEMVNEQEFKNRVSDLGL